MAGVFHASPSQCRVQIVAAVHKHGAGFDLGGQGFGGRGVARPDGGGEAVAAVVHQPHRFGVVRHRHNPHHRAEAFFVHHAHSVVHIHQHLRRQIGGAGAAGREGGFVNQRRSALCHGFGNLGAHKIGGAAAHHRPQIGVGIGGVAQAVLAGDAHKFGHKGVVCRLMHINALNAAAGLAGIKEGAVHQIFGGIGHIGIGAHIGRVFAAQLQPAADKALA